ncbi:PAN domain-containing protein [Nordella sp. HKS 07]|uniref:PAN domain-containing protein n=1 Tax=Nordella sp. HKS 07 TaxID=2712222 RepID=UPI0019D03B96|nr:PAN domain-containing protein [Nordella sp. HKS 07]
MSIILHRIVVLFGILFLTTLAAQAQEWNTDRPGNDIRDLDLRAPDFNLCRQACEKNASCKAWTYVNPGVQGPQARCYLKSPAPAKVANNCCVSGEKVADTSDREDICRDYSVRAVQQNDENLRLRCNFTGSSWQSNRDEHFNWCMSASRADREREDRNRINKLAECRSSGGGGGGGREDECRDYAEEAVTGAREARDLGCGYTGARWSQRYGEHYNWCLGATREQVRAERTARAQDLRSCRAGNDGGDRAEACRDYAEEAVSQIADAKRRDCRFTGARWQGGYNVHYNWCMSARRSEREAESRGRAEELRRCRSGDSEGDRAEACRDYSRLSMAQIREASRLGCGFGGARWQASSAAHYEWCMTARRADREAELRAREASLERCRADAGGGGEDDAGCVDFANRAVRQAQRNRALRCGFEGPRWRPDFDTHYSWCQSAPQQARVREDAKRQDLLNLCAAKPDKAQECRRYSNLSIEQQRTNLSEGCGFSGPRWHTNYEDHFVWCMDASGGKRLAEIAARVGALLVCTR